MKRIAKYFFIIYCTLSLPKGYSQDSTIDSLKVALNKAGNDSLKLKILSELSEVCEIEEIVQYAKPCIELAKKVAAGTKSQNLKILCLKYEAESLHNLGFRARALGESEKAIGFYKEALIISQKIKDKQGEAEYLNSLGVIYYNRGDITKTLEYYHKSLKLREEIKDMEGIATSLNNIALIYFSQKDTSKAAEYHKQSLKISESIQDQSGIANSLNNLGLLYRSRSTLNKSLDYYRKALTIYLKLNEKNGIATALGNIGLIYKYKGDIDSALIYYNRSLKLMEELHNKQGITFSLSNIAFALFKDERTTEALFYAESSLKKSKELGFPENILSSAVMLKLIYKKQNKYKEAFEMYELETKMRDSINNQETQKAALKKQMQYAYEKKELVMKAEQDKKDVISAEELKQKENERNYFIAGFGLVIILALFIFRGYRQKQIINKLITHQKQLVEEKQKEILDSIHYAKRIQTALMTNENYIDKSLDRLQKN